MPRRTHPRPNLRTSKKERKRDRIRQLTPTLPAADLDRHVTDHDYDRDNEPTEPTRGGGGPGGRRAQGPMGAASATLSRSVIPASQDPAGPTAATRRPVGEAR